MAKPPTALDDALAGEGRVVMLARDVGTGNTQKSGAQIPKNLRRVWGQGVPEGLPRGDCIAMTVRGIPSKSAGVRSTPTVFSKLALPSTTLNIKRYLSRFTDGDPPGVGGR